jgi:nicotinamide-nucleotide amidase
MADDARGEQLAALADDHDVSLAVAESLTGGALASRLSRLPGAGEWFRGSIVAYSADVKHDLLDVPPGPVVSEAAVRAMAQGVARLLGAELTIGVSGEAGPEPQDDVPVGTVWMAVCEGGDTVARRLHLDGDPGEVVRATCDVAVDWLTERLLSRARAD